MNFHSNLLFAQRIRKIVEHFLEMQSYQRPYTVYFLQGIKYTTGRIKNKRKNRALRKGLSLPSWKSRKIIYSPMP